MNFKFFIFFIFSVFCSLTVFNKKENYESVFQLNELRKIRVELNRPWISYTGLPIESKSIFFEMCVNDYDTISTHIDDISIYFFIHLDTINIESQGHEFNLRGKFLIPPMPSIFYDHTLDVATYEATFNPSYIYEPVRFGEWHLNTQEGEKINEFKVKFVDTLSRCK
jgi:hypothetical protein